MTTTTEERVCIDRVLMELEPRLEAEAGMGSPMARRAADRIRAACVRHRCVMGSLSMALPITATPAYSGGGDDDDVVTQAPAAGWSGRIYQYNVDLVMLRGRLEGWLAKRRWGSRQLREVCDLVSLALLTAPTDDPRLGHIRLCVLKDEAAGAWHHTLVNEYAELRTLVRLPVDGVFWSYEPQV